MNEQRLQHIEQVAYQIGSYITGRLAQESDITSQEGLIAMAVAMQSVLYTLSDVMNIPKDYLVDTFCEALKEDITAPPRDPKVVT